MIIKFVIKFLPTCLPSGLTVAAPDAFGRIPGVLKGRPLHGDEANIEIFRAVHELIKTSNRFTWNNFSLRSSLHHINIFSSFLWFIYFIILFIYLILYVYIFNLLHVSDIA